MHSPALIRLPDTMPASKMASMHCKSLGSVAHFQMQCFFRGIRYMPGMVMIPSPSASNHAMESFCGASKNFRNAVFEVAKPLLVNLYIYHLAGTSLKCVYDQNFTVPHLFSLLL